MTKWQNNKSTQIKYTKQDKDQKESLMLCVRAVSRSYAVYESNRFLIPPVFPSPNLTIVDRVLPMLLFCFLFKRNLTRLKSGTGTLLRIWNSFAWTVFANAQTHRRVSMSDLLDYESLTCCFSYFLSSDFISLIFSRNILSNRLWGKRIRQNIHVTAINWYSATRQEYNTYCKDMIKGLMTYFLGVSDNDFGGRPKQ